MSNLGPGDWQGAKLFVPDGHHLRPARDVDGVVRALLFQDGTNKMVGPPVAYLDPPTGEQDGDTDSPPHIGADPSLVRELLSDILAQALIAAGATIIEVGTPLLLKWWKNRAWPAIKLRWSERHNNRTQAEASAVEAAMWAVGVTGEVKATTQPAQLQSMTIDEVQARQIAMLTAVRFLVEQHGALQDRRIVDGPSSSGGADMDGVLTADQIEAGVRAILDRGQAFVDDDTAAELRTTVASLSLNGLEGHPALSTATKDEDGRAPA